MADYVESAPRLASLKMQRRSRRVTTTCAGRFCGCRGGWWLRAVGVDLIFPAMEPHRYSALKCALLTTMLLDMLGVHGGSIHS